MKISRKTEDNKQYAIDYHELQIEDQTYPFMTVIVDGGGTKSSHGHSYSFIANKKTPEGW